MQLILQRDGLSLQPESVPFNVYSKTKCSLSISILDENCSDVAKYLITRFLSKVHLFGDIGIPDIASITGPRDLVSKAKNSKGTTIKRSGKSAVLAEQTERAINEEKRQRLVARQGKYTAGLSSDMNACQALVKPDCSKHKVTKASGMPIALSQLLCASLGRPDKSLTQKERESILMTEKLIYLRQEEMPGHIVQHATFASIEFAGVKFKTTPGLTAENYVAQVEKMYISKMIHQFPRLNRMVICEEKYMYTPDDFKAATRAQRTSKQSDGISHLKSAEEMIQGRKLDTDGLRSTLVGKSAMSTYLAENVHQFNIKQNLVLDIDSEYKVGGCVCDRENEICTCNTYAIPLRCKFSNSGEKELSQLDEIHQRKGEAEMAQVDWLLSAASELKAGASAVSIVTSGDIDAVVIHMFALAMNWPRHVDRSFCFPVYVILQKPGGIIDIYNVTRILEVLEQSHGGDITIGGKVAIGLCMGGNDFIPKFQYISHSKVLSMLIDTPKFLNDLFIIKEPHITVDPVVYQEFIKRLYCPKHKELNSFDDVRKSTIIRKQSRSSDMPGLSNSWNNPDKWLPPAPVLSKMASLVDLQIEYLLSVGVHSAKQPDFLARGCLAKTMTGEIEYDFGVSRKMSKTELNELQKQLSGTDTPTKKKKRLVIKTPQGGKRKKKQKSMSFASLPVPSETKMPVPRMHSTPSK